MEGESPTLIVFHDVIVDMISNKKFQIVVIELFVWSSCLFTKYLFGIHHTIIAVPNNVRLITTHFFIKYIRKKQQELQQFFTNHSSELRRQYIEILL